MQGTEFVSAVVNWFQKNGRILPWREGRNPYRIWISEVMLQQTRIEAVIPYYHRFMQTFPDLESLARAKEEDLFKLWEGLGYYSRAKNLKKTAEILVSQYEGRLPEEPSQLITLPGIGEYTSGAIASIAFGKPAPAVDGNVLRVMARVLGDRRDILQPATKKSITAHLAALYPEGSAAGDLTEGIMELGERICIPNGVPLCDDCPLRKLCAAAREGSWTEIPVREKRAARRIEQKTVFLLRSDGKVAICQRPEKGLLAGMWEFYHIEGKKNKKDAVSYLEKEGFRILSVRPVGTAKHIFTHLEWRMTGYEVILDRTREPFVWETPETIRSHYAVPKAFHFFLNALS